MNITEVRREPVAPISFVKSIWIAKPTFDQNDELTLKLADLDKLEKDLRESDGADLEPFNQGYRDFVFWMIESELLVDAEGNRIEASSSDDLRQVFGQPDLAEIIKEYLEAVLGKIVETSEVESSDTTSTTVDGDQTN